MLDIDSQIKYRQLFFEESKKLVNTMREFASNSMDHKNSMELYKTVHTLKAMSQVMGFEHITKECHSFESKIKANQLTEDAFLSHIEKITLMIDKEEQPLAHIKDSQGLDISEDSFDRIISLLSFIVDAIGELPMKRKALVFSYLRDIYAHLIPCRLTPIGDINKHLMRVVSTYQRINKKKINLIFEGKEVIVDKGILGAITRVLIQLVRNAIAHGIEPSEDRVKKKKKPDGTINVKAEIVDRELVLSVKDDGAGINYTKVRETIEENNLDKGISKEKLAKKEYLNKFLFKAQFTTTKNADEYSGLGMGLNEVKDLISALSGVIAIITEESKGACFIVKIPTKVFYCKQYLFKVGDMLLSVDPTCIKRTYRLLAPKDEKKELKARKGATINMTRFLIKKERPEYVAADITYMGKDYTLLFDIELVEKELLILSQKKELFWKAFTKEAQVVMALNLDYLVENY